jgi:glutamate synthase (NADPH/NADH) small chain
MDDQKQPVPGSEMDLEADLALVAIGQAKLGSLLSKLDGIALERGRIVVDAVGATGRKGWYAGGDAANGGKEVVNAAAEGKAAAHGIHQYLSGGTHA